MSVWLALAGTALTAVAALVGVIVTARGAQAAARESARAAPYEALAERVDVLEDEVAELRRDQHQDRTYIRKAAPLVPQVTPPHWYVEETGWGDGQPTEPPLPR